MRLVGAIMILGGCTGLGLWYRNQLTGRIRALRMLTAILEMLMSEIRYGKSTLPECCRKLTMHVEEPYRSALENVSHEYEDTSGASFQEIFVRQMAQAMETLPLKREDGDCFLAPFQNQGFQDAQMQLRSLEQSLLQLDDIIRVQNEERREKCRMAVGLGVMSGLLLIIIMV